MGTWAPNDAETIRQVIELWNAGKTSGQIGRTLGLTRNRVIGIVDRQRRKHPDAVLAKLAAKPATTKWVPPAPKPAPAVVVPLPRRSVVPDEPVTQESRSLKPAGLRSVTGCRYIVGRKDGAALYCNDPKRDDPRQRPYCEHHFSLMYYKPSRRAG